MTTGVLYLWWGDNGDLLMRSIASLKKHNPGLPVKVEKLFDATLLDKARMGSLTPFDTTLFLDTDTVVFGDLSYGFEKAAKFGLACCICECPWARRFPALSDERHLIEYNTGVLFFTRDCPVMTRWAEIAPELDSHLRFTVNGEMKVMGLNDQASFAQAVDGFCPFVLPLNWNFRPEFHRAFFGDVRIWHDKNEPTGVQEWNELQRDSVRWGHTY